MEGSSTLYSRSGSFAKVDVSPFESLIVDLVRGLIAEGCERGNWEDARGSGDVLIALSEVLDESAFPRLRSDAYRHLTSLAIRSDGTATWGEEVWDTAIALIALCRMPSPDRALIADGARWLAELYRKSDGNWYYEPWDSLWALVAMHDALALVPDAAPEFDPKPALVWLLSVFDHGRGQLVNSHNSAQFLIASSRWLDHPVMIAPSSALAEELQAARVVAADTLMSSLRQDGQLWRADLWANSLIVWGLADAGAVALDPSGRSEVAQGFRDSMKRNSPTEDRAFAVIALSRLVRTLSGTTASCLPEGILAFERRYPDPALRALLEHVRAVQYAQDTDIHRSRITARVGDMPDFQHRPPVISRGTFRGYYTLNLRQSAVNIAAILITTIFLTLLSGATATMIEGRFAWLLTAIPIGLGMLATIAQILDVRPAQWFSRRS